MAEDRERNKGDVEAHVHKGDVEAHVHKGDVEAHSLRAEDQDKRQADDDDDVEAHMLKNRVKNAADA
jgi:hypothetical protein